MDEGGRPLPVRGQCLRESWHRIEYHRIERGVVGPAVDAEEVNNHGFAVSWGGTTRERAEDWLRYCAQDWFERAHAEPGRWIAVMWRLTDDRAPLHEMARLEFRWRSNADQSVRARSA
ncbi:hypothetical protein M8C13_32425 [Crossiella sp. SN42]|uniref:hypothetical protein n=1 Tax=Crossiella sp. SN42 TaxID=2944808 RepID=UPI00207C6822|nr:hypothetical protein [Crossiella sp. SN42]MCO1580470.1 hypothetical protein [Crossiella sp. SN42]